MRTKSTEKINIYEIVTRKIIEQLEAGTVPWHKSWVGSEAINFVTRKPYQGINRLLLPFGGEWLTFKQAKDADGHIRKGEKSSIIVFFKWVEKKDIDRQDGEEVEYIPYLQYSNVFHISQCEGIESKLEPMAADIINHPIEDAQRILESYILRSAVKVRHIEGSNQALYCPNKDSITMPIMSQFNTSESYYNVVFHEAAHSTGHKSRLNRDMSVAAYGSKNYGREELLAEICAAFVMNAAGIDAEKSIEDSAGYIQSWLKAIREDNRAIVVASSKAQKAADLILGVETDSAA